MLNLLSVYMYRIHIPYFGRGFSEHVIYDKKKKFYFKKILKEKI